MRMRRITAQTLLAIPLLMPLHHPHCTSHQHRPQITTSSSAKIPAHQQHLHHRGSQVGHHLIPPGTASRDKLRNPSRPHLQRDQSHDLPRYLAPQRRIPHPRRRLHSIQRRRQTCRRRHIHALRKPRRFHVSTHAHPPLFRSRSPLSTCGGRRLSPGPAATHRWTAGPIPGPWTAQRSRPGSCVARQGRPRGLPATPHKAQRAPLPSVKNTNVIR